MRRADFDYELPEDLIAQSPSGQRSGARLLHLRGAHRDDRQVTDLPHLLRSGDLLVFNDTRVIPARVHGHKSTGGSVEILVERVLDDRRFLAQLGVSKTPKPGGLINAGGRSLRVLSREDDLFELLLEGEGAVLDWLEAAGQLPLPPYIDHAPDAVDAERYQTVFARAPGAVAAPTAGLHFDEALLAALQQAGVQTATITLHVGAGTFQPVRVDDVADHRMHSERYVVPEGLRERIREIRAGGGRVVAVGTTVARTLEAAVDDEGLPRTGSGETRLFITPGYRFRAIDLLMTNFHLPQSTLLMLVCAFGGQVPMLAAYRHAVAARYRFFSYGDAMLIEPSMVLTP